MYIFVCLTTFPFKIAYLQWKKFKSINYLALIKKNISLKAKVEEDGEALRLEYLNIFIDSQHESLICKSFEIIMSSDTGVLQIGRTFVLNILIYIHAKL